MRNAILNRFTARQRVGASAVATVGLVVVVAAAADAMRIAVAAAAGLLAAALLILLDTRRQLGAWRRELNGVPDKIRAEALNDMAAGIGRIDANVNRQARSLRETQRELTELIDDQTQEIEAIHQLYGGLTPRHSMPSTGPWLRAPRLVALRCLIEQTHPQLVVELGSGTATIWLGYAIEAYGGRLVSVHHIEDNAQATRAAVDMHGLSNTVDVSHAPLSPVMLGDEAAYHWYDTAAFDDIKNIDLLLVSGPPGGVRPEAKYPAVPVLADRLSAGAVIAFYNADPQEAESIASRWADVLPSLSRAGGDSAHHIVMRVGDSDVTSV